MNTDKKITIIVVIGIAIFLIIYLIVLIVWYNNDSGIFSPYVQPPLDGSYFQPLGKITALTPDEQAARKAAYTTIPPSAF